jgi:DNA-binding MarR family transcriptional regulator
MTRKSAVEAGFQLFTEIAIIDQLARTAFERRLPEGLSVMGFGVLNHFARLGLAQESPARLARAFQVTKGAMTFILQRLELIGAIAITADPDDGRGKIVKVTARGRKLREQAIAAVAPLVGEVVAALGRKTVEALSPTLAQLRAYMDLNRN